ncbi:MAG: hypothetical protein WA954_11145 [Parerythrobacter sp.]
MLISGGASTGKVTPLNGMIGGIPKQDRMVLVKDVPELPLLAGGLR